MSTSPITEASAPTTSKAQEPEETRVISLPGLCVFAVAIGVVAAAGAVIFRFLIAVVHNFFFYGKFSFAFDANHVGEPSPWGAGIILAPVIGGLIVVYLVRTFAPEAKGHGVPEVMYAIYHKRGNVRGIVAVVKSLASAISIGSGASVGREGPIIQIGAAFGSSLARAFNLVRWQKITLLAAGAGAGIAATFNTPFGGVLFAVEILLPEFSNRTFLPVVVATATATYVMHVVLGVETAFFVPTATDIQHGAIAIEQLAGFAILGFLAGFVSWAFIRVLEKCEDWFPKLPGNEYTQNIIGMLLVGSMSYAFFVTTGAYHTAGVGYAAIQDILNDNPQTFVLLGCLLVGKLLATSISLGSGASGGVFAPSLFLGACTGGLVGLAGQHLFPGSEFSIAEFGLVGMGAVVGGATGGAMTAIMMIFEMTRDYNVMVPLVLAVALAVGVRRWLITANIYTIKLRNRGRPIPTNRFTNMYLVQQAHDLMSPNFLLLDSSVRVCDAIALMDAKDVDHVVVVTGKRIDGYLKYDALQHRGSEAANLELCDVVSRDYLVAPETSIMNTVISRMNKHNRRYGIVVQNTKGIPRPEDVVGVIDRTEIAEAVIANHYA
ncbi:chloride channel protein [Pseudovibrio exalbescens]|uniref:chloride channel protein n=1 Tax=Pseudovibrio exalbescens TaxID=197461 RepID=UPI00236530CA|nr:chloride channel protein [Pseudovibrio exalbescens]MDD7910339.1 chloride channel protein [Pseudovibrio exalbescens]